MPRLVTPYSNPHVHGSHTLTPYTRRQRSSLSPSTSDKENTTPEQSQQPTKMNASQAALKEKLAANTHRQYYDPDQAREVNREVMREYRQMIQDVNEYRTEYLKPGNDGLQKTVTRADQVFEEKVRTTTAANLDSKLLVTTSDLAKVKARNMNFGDAAFNIDDYVTKLVTFMGGRHHVRGRARNPEDDEEMDWTSLGRVALGICRRPPTLDFLLGPLSVEKKEKKVRKRQTENLKSAPVTRPQELQEEDIQRQENMTSQMVRQVAELLRQYSPINLFEFVINPDSFSQTIENIFYLSFSIRDARAKIDMDGNGLPVISFVEALDDDDMLIENKQCILEMTMKQHEELVDVLNITTSMIPHREEETHSTTARSWY